MEQEKEFAEEELILDEDDEKEAKKSFLVFRQLKKDVSIIL